MNLKESNMTDTPPSEVKCRICGYYRESDPCKDCTVSVKYLMCSCGSVECRAHHDRVMIKAGIKEFTLKYHIAKSLKDELNKQDELK